MRLERALLLLYLLKAFPFNVAVSVLAIYHVSYLVSLISVCFATVVGYLLIENHLRNMSCFRLPRLSFLVLA